MRLGWAVVALLVAAAACAPTMMGPSKRAGDKLAGHYEGTGGGAPLAVVRALTARFSELHPGVSWGLDETSSDAGIALAAAGDIDIAWVTRNLKEREASVVAAVEIGATGTAVAVNAANPVSELSKDQVRRIFAGEIGDWAALGGLPGKIRVLIREPNAATRTAFEAFFFPDVPRYSASAAQVFELDEMATTLRSFRDSIGMVTLDKRSLSDSQIKLVAIDGVEATLPNLINGAYKVRRPIYLIHSSKPERVKPAVKAFFDFVKGPEGQRIIARELGGA
jgi:phosphate transport system substrate-binding protein